MIKSNDINLKYCKMNDNNLKLDCEVFKQIDSKYDFLNTDYFNQPRLIKASNLNEIVFYSPIEFLSIICYNNLLLDFIGEILEEEETKKISKNLNLYSDTITESFRNDYKELCEDKVITKYINNIHFFIDRNKRILIPIYDLLKLLNSTKSLSINLDSVESIPKLQLKYLTKCINIKVGSSTEDLIVKKMNISTRTIGLLNIDKRYGLNQIEKINKLTDLISNIPGYNLPENKFNELVYDLNRFAVEDRYIFNQVIFNYYCYILNFLESEW